MKEITQEDLNELETKQYTIFAELFLGDTEFKAVIYKLNRYLFVSGARHSYSNKDNHFFLENKFRMVQQIEDGYVKVHVTTNSKVHDKIVEIITN